VGARDLIEQGFLTEPVIGGTMAEGYDTHGLTPNAQGKFDAADVDRAYHGHGRKTAAIVADVVRQAQDRQGVMFFAATVRHAQEIMASLPPELSVMVTGETGKSERDSLIRRFKAKAIKYLVNVSVLTTGFDAPHVDLIAILRKTESVGLLQQIIGRGLRICPGCEGGQVGRVRRDCGDMPDLRF
jgi:DNA repair protein RadD